MKLLTKAIEKVIPALYTNDGKDPEEVKICAKFFCPWNQWTWYATEYDPEQGLFYGYVKGSASEYGYFTLEELEYVRGPFGMKIERDRNFTGNLSDVVEVSG